MRRNKRGQGKEKKEGEEQKKQRNKEKERPERKRTKHAPHAYAWTKKGKRQQRGETIYKGQERGYKEQEKYK